MEFHLKEDDTATWDCVLEIEIVFTYDPTKDELNFQKHKVHLSTANLFIEADNDPDVEYDEANSTCGETRYRGAYRWNDHYLFIVYTMREETIRLISARPATKGEIMRYYQRH